LMRHWQPVGVKTSVTCSQLHPENESELSINDSMCCIFRNKGIARIYLHVTELLPSLIGKSTMYEWLNMDSQLNNIANCKVCKNILLVVDNTILIRYY
jgi:hypothetical protein